MHTNLKSYEQLFEVSKSYCGFIDYLAQNGWERSGATRIDYERDPYNNSYTAHKFYEKNRHINAITVSLIPCRYLPIIQDVNLLAVDEYTAIDIGEGFIEPDNNIRFEHHELLRLDINSVTLNHVNNIIRYFNNKKTAQVDLRPSAKVNTDYGIKLSYNQYLGKDLFEYFTEDGISIHRSLNTVGYESYIKNDLFS